MFVSNMRVEYSVGDVVAVKDSFGDGPIYHARVEERGRKKGRDTGAGTVVRGYKARPPSADVKEGDGKWWYDNQVVRVVRRGG